MTPAPRSLLLPPEAAGERLDRALARSLGPSVSVREVRRALEDGRITVDGRRAVPGARARVGVEVDLSAFVARADAEVSPEPELAARAPVIASWPDLFALDKPSGVPCAPLRPGERGTLLGGAVHHRALVASAGPPLEGGLLHRLDGGTSGAVLFALTEEARAIGRGWFARHEVAKTYLAVVSPRQDLPPFIDAPIGAGEGAHRVAVGGARDALPARSDFEVLSSMQFGLLVRVKTRFGRRHQVRAHLAHLGAPIVGDALYGGAPEERLMLHAETIELPDGRAVRAPTPKGFS